MGWLLETQVQFEKWGLMVNYKTKNKRGAIKKLDGSYSLGNEYEELR